MKGVSVKKVIKKSEIITQVMDHHGLVAGACLDLKIAEKINAKIASKDPRRVVQPGEAVVAMIINGLGFTNRRLYLTPQFFKSKAIESFFENKITADDLDDHALGKALDEISQYGSSKMFGEIAFEIAMEQNLLGDKAHLDSTSFVLQGQYEGSLENENIVEVKHGFSKDHRPDLKQILLSMVVTSSANIPVWMEPLSGNKSDKTSFHETIKNVREFQRQLKINHDFTWIADSALYTPEKLLAHDNFSWISRVPETIKECQKFIEKPDEDFDWQTGDDGYRYSESISNYGNIRQRWILISSEQAYRREEKTFEKKIKNSQESLEKECWHLGNQLFSCETDAKKETAKLQKKYPFFIIKTQIINIEKHVKKGRPVDSAIKQTLGVKVVYSISKQDSVIKIALRKKGRFVLATNILDPIKMPMAKILQQYKEQQGVECGFRFLKDPWFMIDSFYLKKCSRIEALMMVMTLCLLVYNFLQHRIRSALKRTNDTLPNQLNKQVQNPTTRWIFQIMEGIAVIKICNKKDGFRDIMITNLDSLRSKIIKLLGPVTCEIYGI